MFADDKKPDAPPPNITPTTDRPDKGDSSNTEETTTKVSEKMKALMSFVKTLIPRNCQQSPSMTTYLLSGRKRGHCLEILAYPR